MIPYSYAVLRYVPDAAAGEQINIGVLFYAPQVPCARLLCDERTSHLKQLFNGFDADEFLAYLRDLRTSVVRMQINMECHSLCPADAGDFAHYLIPDNGLSFQFGSVGAGVMRPENVEVTADNLLDRFVLGLRPTKEPSHDHDNPKTQEIHPQP